MQTLVKKQTMGLGSIKTIALNILVIPEIL